ncbi:MAG: RNA polymerase sigma factor [Paludibacter sp.]|nr:RNA polymerase sigma factor [Paludibacter sp.]
MSETTDASITSMIKNPDTKDKGFLLLMNTYKKPIYWHIRRLVVSHEDAEDILQETFILVYRFASSFKGDSKISTWLYRIATNECFRYFKKKDNNIRYEGFIAESAAMEQAETDMENGEVMLLKFQQAIQRLPERQKIVFNLRYYDELSYEDIAKILNSSVSALKTNYHLANEKVKKYLIEHA